MELTIFAFWLCIITSKLEASVSLYGLKGMTAIEKSPACLHTFLCRQKSHAAPTRRFRGFRVDTEFSLVMLQNVTLVVKTGCELPCLIGSTGSLNS